jgi:hypothetical protein
MAGAPNWARVVVTSADGTARTLSWRGRGRPTLADVEGLARLQLASRRAGGHIHVDEVCPALYELLDLAGLLSEMQGKAE